VARFHQSGAFQPWLKAPGPLVQLAPSEPIAPRECGWKHGDSGHLAGEQNIVSRNENRIGLISGRWDLPVEINVRAQVCTLAKTAIIRRAWQRQTGPEIHGWVYNLRTGFLNELVSMHAAARADNVYPFEEQRDVGA
jgi:carbonic anhydrase-like protein